MAGFADLGNQFKLLYDNFTIGQKVSIVIMLFLLAAVFGSLIFWAGRPEFQVLYTKLSPQDAQTVVSEIEGKVKYELRDNGTTVLVPGESLYKLRLELASKGLPKGGVVGFEIFDKTAFGVTDFAQRVNYKRAIEGELTRTIMQIDSVDSAKAMIAIPEKRLFDEEKKETTASIVLGLRSQGALSKSQVQGIVYLVSSSVEDLKPGNITVIDTKGNLLFKGRADTEAELASTQYEFKKYYETNLEEKIKAMVEKVVGVDKAVAMVSAEFDFDVVNKTEEVFDPDRVVVLSEQRSTETSDSKSPAPSGTPGVGSNIPPTAAGGAGKEATSTSKKTSETINYELSKVVKSTKESVGNLLKQSISLIVDGVYKEIVEEGGEGKEGEEGEEVKKKFEYSPRSIEELDKISALVKSAAGFNEERGDQIEIESMQFQKAEIGIPAAVSIFKEEGKGIWYQFGKYAVTGVIALFVILFVIRPMTKWISQVPKVVMSEGEMMRPGGVTRAAPRRTGRTAEDIEREREMEMKDLEAEIAGESKMPEGAKRKQAIKHRLSRLADKDADSVAQLVKTWIHED
jgi:flagellar M-ring protein FliF